MTRYTYTGREFDHECSTYHFRARIYSPTLGRFTGHDPILYPDGYNTYAGWSATGNLDPIGLDSISIDDDFYCDTFPTIPQKADLTPPNDFVGTVFETRSCEWPMSKVCKNYQENIEWIELRKGDATISGREYGIFYTKHMVRYLDYGKRGANEGAEV